MGELENASWWIVNQWEDDGRVAKTILDTDEIVLIEQAYNDEGTRIVTRGGVEVFAERSIDEVLAALKIRVREDY